MKIYGVTRSQMITLLLVGVAVLTACSGLTPISTHVLPTTEDSEPLEVVNAFHAAINSGHALIASALFAEDAVITQDSLVLFSPNN